MPALFQGNIYIMAVRYSDPSPLIVLALLPQAISLPLYIVSPLWPDCRGDIASNNIEVRKIYKELKQKNAGIEDNDDWSTQDDPRAKTEQLYGKVSKVSTKSAYAPVSTLDEMI
jgi:hypothetical protein